MANFPGTNNTDILIGSDGDDTMTGLGGNDQLSGGSGNDIIDGGSGDDLISGGPGTDTLTGGTGVDTFRDTAAGLNGDHITDFQPGDRIIITDLTAGNLNLGVSGSAITYNGGSVFIDNLGPGRLVVRDLGASGVEIRLQGPAANDFNGDGISDILWHRDDGALTDWLGNLNGGFTPNGQNELEVVNPIWHIAGTGDFNGDGLVDILWHRDDGAMTDWLGTHNGSFAPNGANELEVINPQWQIAATGDFNGDGRDDILWHRDDGAMTDWLGNPNGSFTPNAANALEVVATQWQIVGAGDFNGDGRDDILWRNVDGRITDWLGTPTGGFADNVANALNGVSLDWHVAGIGDFNGDGRDDILWRNTDGRVTDWLGTANGGFAPNSGAFLASVSTDWSVAAIGDYNGDARDDILWRNADGRTYDWLGQTNGSFSNNSANSLTTVDPIWHPQPVHDHFF